MIFKLVGVFMALFLLTCLLCWFSITVLLRNPLCGIGGLIGGVFAVVTTIDAITLRLTAAKARR